MRSKRRETKRSFYLVNMILFIGFAFEFFIRNDNFLGILLIVNGVINLLAYQQAPRKIASITVILNLFNALVSGTIAYNYADINYQTLLYIWSAVCIAYVISALSQIYNLIENKRSKMRHKKRRN